MADSNVFELNNSNFQAEVLDSDQPVLVDFWAEWCGPCRQVAPVIDQLAQEFSGKLKVGKVNVDSEQQLAAQYGVMSIPTLLIFKSGEPVERIVGAQPKEVMSQKLKTLL